MEAICSVETSVNIYRNTRPYVPENGTLNSYSGNNLIYVKSLNILIKLPKIRTEKQLSIIYFFLSYSYYSLARSLFVCFFLSLISSGPRKWENPKNIISYTHQYNVPTSLENS
jgi:hypothetical protein